MIRCPTCGTLNQDSQNACSNCGQALPQTKIRCPECGTLNPVGNLFCDNCNARLVQSEGIIPSDLPAEPDSHPESTSVKGISLPTRVTANHSGANQNSEDELPDWLRGLTEESEEFFGATDTTSETSEEDTTDTDSNYPDWLSGLLDENADFGAVEDLEEDQGEGQGAFTLEPAALPDWFTPETPLENEPAPELDTRNDSLTDLPDWLSETADTRSAQPAEQEATDLPDWLLASAEPASTSAPVETELPDWLLNASGEDDATVLPPETPTTEAIDETEPWYAPVSDSLQESTEPESDRPQYDEEPLVFSESELPGWLTEAHTVTEDTQDSETPSTAPTQPASEPEVSTELPDWLTAADDSKAFGSIELPDWLQEPSTTPAPEPATSTYAEPPEAQPETTQGESQHPDATGRDSETVDTPEKQESSPALLTPEPADLPDWLSGLDSTNASYDDTEVFHDTEEAPAEPKTEPQARPNWLEGVAPAVETPVYEPKTPAFIREDDDDAAEEHASSEEEPFEMPNWLRELDISEPQPTQAESASISGDMPARAEVPSWLQELMPQQTLATGDEINLLDSSGELIGADIPDWLQALRPEPGEAGALSPQRRKPPTPAEPEGPLQGIPGVLQPFALVDAPADAKSVVEVAIPETVVAQAQLWQSLLEQPRSAQRPVSQRQQRSQATNTLLRILVAAVLVLGLLGALLLLPRGPRLATVSPAQLAPGASAMLAEINKLQPGDRVIVAVEYSTAYAEEMSQIAAPILQHLAAQQADITIVSTLPEGTVLGAILASETITESERVSSKYLAGNAIGISAFLSQTDAQAARHILVLSSQPQRVRWWIEQVQLAYGNTSASVSLSLGASASAGPIIAPYLETLRIQGWLVGLPDALAYDELRNIEDTAEQAHILDALMLAHWAAGGLLVIGLLVSLVTGKKGVRQTHG